MKIEEIKSYDALIVVDPQYDFCPDGALAVAGGDEIMQPINALASDFKDAGALVVLTQDNHPKGHKSFATTWYLEPFAEIEMPYGKQTLWPDHCVQGTVGAAFHPVIASGSTLREADLIIRKGTKIEVDSYSAFRENDRSVTGLEGFLKERGIKRIFVVGLAYDFCVGYSAIDGASAGFETFVIKSLTRAIAAPAILGNNDTGTTADAMDWKLRDAGVTVLENFNTLIEA